MKFKNIFITPCLALALAFAGSAHATGVWSTIEWFDDSDLSFITSTNVTHSADFVGPEGSAAEINGFTFETISIASDFGTFSTPYSGSNFTIDSSGPSSSTFTFDKSAGFRDAASRDLTTGLIGFSAGVGDGASITYTLSGLNKNTNYEFYFFSPDWIGDTRTGVLVADDDSGNAMEIDQTPGTGNEIIKYAYNTGESTSFTITVTSQTDGSSLHYFAFVNIAP